MKIGPFGIFEIVIILIVVLIIFGPKNLPKLGTAIGSAVKNLREGLNGGKKKETKTETSEAAEESKKVEFEVIEGPAPTQSQTEPVEAKPASSAKPAPKSMASQEEKEEA